ncbi:AraC family transcriptional regulator [Actinoallomurus iriomotensis]|uniref:AraC family transcriptional regulator n=1 Tax=Actinoallomurus iriomotensis TaxID=478107 RepID=A0A9W6RLT8_9ACTN|nr:AraC family transcriptional regulator [Actinoallomurus iriomotensis]GLY77864.1 AraC family transcriptional regulator [Actinoallomurus iriomotensis]
MDVLSDAITAMRLGRPHSARTGRRGRWAVRHSSFAGAGFHVVLQGACRLTSEGGSPIALGTGDAVFLPHGSAHQLADGLSDPPADPPVTALTEMEDRLPPDGPDSVVLLCGAYLIDRTRRHPLLDELPEIVHLPSRVGRHPSLRAAIDLLGTELERRRPGADAVLPSLLDALLVYMVRGWLDEQPEGHAATGWTAALRDPRIMAALDGIHDDPARPWTVEELGARAGMSRAAFSRRFTALVGRPPLAYLTWWRMTTAAGLLRDSDLPLSAVATRVGYGSEFAFANAFKRAFGVAPGRYRKQGP